MGRRARPTEETWVAEGTRPDAATEARWRSYRVRIEYREPDYERRSGARANPYRFTYEIEARDAAMAQAMAIEAFHQTALESSVGWHREIVAVRCSENV